MIQKRKQCGHVLTKKKPLIQNKYEEASNTKQIQVAPPVIDQNIV